MNNLLCLLESGFVFNTDRKVEISIAEKVNLSRYKINDNT